jgi:hypothetical protein
MWLCLTYKNYTPGVVGQISGKILDYNSEYHLAAVLSQAEHEFGHILGLVHEQDQPDLPRSCTVKMDQFNVKYDPITKYDEKSIMNYCNPDLKYGRQTTPSCGDIQSIRYLYCNHPYLNLEPDCVLKCASGLTDDNLLKTSASLAACDAPPNRIAGSLANIPDRVLYPDDPQFGGNNDGVTIGEPMDIPTQRGEEPVVVGRIENGSTPDRWQMPLEITNANKLVAGVCLRGIYGRDEVTQTDVLFIGFGTDIYHQPLLPKTVEIPKGYGEVVQPSGLHYTFTPTWPRKVQVKSYSFASVEYGWWSCLSYLCYHIGWARVNLTYPLPGAIEYFNSLDENTVISKRQMAYVNYRATGFRPFLMDKYEVTQRDYMAVMREFPMAWPAAPDAPIENVSFYDAIIYCNRRNELEGLQPVYSYSSVSSYNSSVTMLTDLAADTRKNGYRFPTPGEWNFAYWGGSKSTFPWGEDWTQKLQNGWISSNSKGHPWPVGKKLPNGYGLYDMFGNVKEWVLDGPWESQHAGGDSYAESGTDPSEPSPYKTTLSAGARYPNVGFRAIKNPLNLVPILDLLLQ